MFEGLGRTQQDLLSALLYQAAGMSIEELASQLAVTRTAVRQHLAALERDGLVVRGELRATGRRPEQLYQLSAAGHELFPRHYHLLANLLINEVASLIGHEALVSLMRNLGQKMAADLSATQLDEQQISAHMKDVGYESEVFFRSGGPAQIVAHNCVFHQLAEAHPEVCELDLALIGSLGGGTVQHLECMLRGGAVCRFALTRD
ncbi:metalloregulator ArsR/SmtB family transcription factor [Pseudomonas sp. H9]|uniref:helix-turn-helix transcriptional regulator n=1 Tax=Pseudomonas sp. H9 TaxID=483968 RepID=UPI0010581939|nr:HTH domain-containing protein [Pseudomonas sp. H9]TDF81574.1 HTH domain-containing protein [Pseudomonas sp. H9]